MKKLAFLLTLIVATSFATQAEAMKRYKIKSGIVQYTITGSQSSTETLYWDNHGEQEARYTKGTVSVMGFNNQINEANYIDGDWSYNYDQSNNTATRMNFKELSEAMMKGSNKNNIRDYGKAMMESMGGKKTGTKKILSRKCDVWEVPNYGMNVCIYKESVALESNIDMGMFKMSMIATDFDENASVPKDKLLLPKSAKITTQEIPAENMAQYQEFQKMQAEGQVNFADMFKQMGDMQNQALQQANQEMKANQAQASSDKELELMKRELELKQKEIELREKELQQQEAAQVQEQQKAIGVNDVDKALDTTNKATNAMRGLRSLFNR